MTRTDYYQLTRFIRAMRRLALAGSDTAYDAYQAACNQLPPQNYTPGAVTGKALTRYSFIKKGWKI